jgi:DNA-directed RNA polymerase subunit alpha
MEHIFLPTSVAFEETDRPHVGKLVISPCHQGYGTTLGNALRRVLLSSLPGAAVGAVKIKGVQHEFSGIDGVLEDMIQIILNVKQMAVKSYSNSPVVLTLTKKGIGEITAGDFEKNSDVEVMNKDLKLMTVTDKNKEIEMEVIIEPGRGYVPVSEKDAKNLDLGTILIDSLYTPIRDVGFEIQLVRVGDVTDFEKLILTIETNGTVTPKDAVEQATKILMDHFSLILNVSQEGMAEERLAPVEPEAVSEEEVEEVKPAKKGKKKE